MQKMFVRMAVMIPGNIPHKAETAMVPKVSKNRGSPNLFITKADRTLSRIPMIIRTMRLILPTSFVELFLTCLPKTVHLPSPQTEKFYRVIIPYFISAIFQSSRVSMSCTSISSRMSGTVLTGTRVCSLRMTSLLSR